MLEMSNYTAFNAIYYCTSINSSTHNVLFFCNKDRIKENNAVTKTSNCNINNENYINILKNAQKYTCYRKIYALLSHNFIFIFLHFYFSYFSYIDLSPQLVIVITIQSI